MKIYLFSSIEFTSTNIDLVLEYHKKLMDWRYAMTDKDVERLLKFLEVCDWEWMHSDDSSLVKPDIE